MVKQNNDSYSIVGLNIVYSIICIHITKSVLTQKGQLPGDEISKIIRSQYKFDTKIDKINNLQIELNKQWQCIGDWNSKICKKIKHT